MLAGMKITQAISLKYFLSQIKFNAKKNGARKNIEHENGEN